MVIYYFLSMPIKNIYITGTTNLSDNEIIHAAGIKNYPSIIKLNSSKMKKNIKKLNYVDDVKIKRNIFGKLTIDIKEANILFYNRNNNKLVLSDGKEIAEDNSYGYASLINYVPKNIYKKIITSLDKIDDDILKSISEIEYSPWTSNNVLIDEERFLLRMNDTNIVYTNLLHIDKLNKYIEIYATLEDKKGIIYLDSSSDKISFSSY